VSEREREGERDSRTERNLVVSSDDDDTDACIATVLDGVNDLFAWRIEHSNDANERTVRLHTQSSLVSRLFH